MSEPNTLLDNPVNPEDKTSCSQDKIEERNYKNPSDEANSSKEKASSMTLEELRNKGLLGTLASLFDSSNSAKALLERIRFPRSLMVFCDNLTPLDFFETSCREIQKGRVDGLTFESLLAEAAKLYPGNEELSPWRAYSSNVHSSSGIGLVISGDIGDAIELLDNICELSQQLELVGKINLVFSTENTLSLNLTDANADQALQLQNIINTSFGEEQGLEVRIIGTQFIDHFIRRTYLESPDGGRGDGKFALTNRHNTMLNKHRH